MQEALLRVFVVALGLLMCPRDDPGVEELEDIVTRGSSKHDEQPLGEEEKLGQVLPQNDNRGPQGDKNGIPEELNPSGLYGSENDEISDLDVSTTKQDSEGISVDHKLTEGNLKDKLEPFLSEKYDGEPEIAMKTPQVTSELKETDILTDDSTKEPVKPQGQHEKPDDKKIHSLTEQASPFSHVQTETTKKEASEKGLADWERDYLWYIWNTFSLISIIRFFRKYFGTSFQMNQRVTRAFPVICTAAEVPLPDVSTLQHFYAKCVQVTSEKWREMEFLEGFADDLIEAMKTISDKDGSMVIKGLETVNACDIRVVFTPPEPYHFQRLRYADRASDPLSDVQVCGQIKLVEETKSQNGCPCQTSDGDDDMVCLLHCDNEKVRAKITDVCDGPLCSKSTPLLSKSQVTRWFQGTIKQAWALISHKYEFELHIRYMEAPGALVIRFRTGKKISFGMSPVIKFDNDAHFLITPWCSSDLDTFWTLSLSTYEDRLLEHLSTRLPENSCHNQTLEIVRFLHKRQTSLSGSSGLKDFHFKTALMHLLLNKKPSEWRQDYVACRLRDLLGFVERSLEKKLLNHVLIGNPVADIIDLPAEFVKAKPVNLFHPLVVHSCMYRNAVMHFQEMLRNSHMLIHDYVAQ
ncbi:inositol 1,4,5-trisphosphate receptor-interacting protein [Cololabis saira]|uniref:inositol 1,4,5-trisphosphate receptor-interacting protein n=1 Tax=Cololabis saira TaxID=129043 RepID=UPI002AD580CF|nr:inositol 1,4,5-trisphosphate receptor-interacting protein [Cololabis saira]